MNDMTIDTGIRKMTGAQMVVQAMKDHGVEHLFGYPGGAVLPIYDALFQQNDVKHILVRHEQGAGHAAEGYARSTNKVGVMLVTSGPGATNAVTPLQDALMDSIPLVCITGQVPTTLIGSDAFQECDTVGITRPCTKHNWLVKSVEDLAEILHEAFHVATSGRPGPVVVDIPKDVQFATGTYTPPAASRATLRYRPKLDADRNRVQAMAEGEENSSGTVVSGADAAAVAEGEAPEGVRGGRIVVRAEVGDDLLDAALASFRECNVAELKTGQG